MLVMAMMTGDPNRVIKGWDVAGNVCGQPNKKISGVPWSGLDMTNKPYGTQRFMFIASLVKALFHLVLEAMSSDTITKFNVANIISRVGEIPWDTATCFHTLL